MKTKIKVEYDHGNRSHTVTEIIRREPANAFLADMLAILTDVIDTHPEVKINNIWFYEVDEIKKAMEER